MTKEIFSRLKTFKVGGGGSDHVAGTHDGATPAKDLRNLVEFTDEFGGLGFGGVKVGAFGFGTSLVIFLFDDFNFASLRRAIGVGDGIAVLIGDVFGNGGFFLMARSNIGGVVVEFRT